MTTAPESEFAEADADWLLGEGRRHDLAGRIMEAVECYARAIDQTSQEHAPRTRTEALRRLGVLHHLRGEMQAGRDLCERSYEVALQAGADDLAAAALNALAGFDFEQGLIPAALGRYSHALEQAADTPLLVAMIENNLGNLASSRADSSAAAEHYARSLAASERAQDRRGCAFAYHNLGRLHADQRQWMDADRCFQMSAQLADSAGDRHLSGLVSLNQAEVHLAFGEYDAARQHAEGALGAFVQQDARRDRAGAHRILGLIFREMDRPALAESHLRSALEMARGADCPLGVADALRELGKLYSNSGRTVQALTCLGEARELYARLNARQDLAETAAEERELQTA
jgi:tetratricopeptide (TPR) repeat protein